MRGWGPQGSGMVGAQFRKTKLRQGWDMIEAQGEVEDGWGMIGACLGQIYLALKSVTSVLIIGFITRT